MNITSEAIKQDTAKFLSRGGVVEELHPTDRAEKVEISKKTKAKISNPMFLHDL